MKKVFVTEHAHWYAQPLLWTGLYEITHHIEDADLCLFVGGEDVDPSLYGQALGSHTYCNPQRDEREKLQFDTCMGYGIPMVGVCRGAQFLTVMAGGKLIQHVSNHGTRVGHDMTTSTNDVIRVSSTHHQMMNPYGTANHKLLAWANGLSETYLDGDDKEHVPSIDLPAVFPEPEVVFYPDINALCVQYHPEIMRQGDAGVKYFQELVWNLLNKKL